MRIFFVTQDFTLDINMFRRHYFSVTNLEVVEVNRLYVDIGKEVVLIVEKLKNDYIEAHSEISGVEKKDLNVGELGLQFFSEEVSLPWPFFPRRLGRISSRFVGDELCFHHQENILSAQLQSLRASKPDKRHFRIAVVNGFGRNLGDCTIGISAFRQIFECLSLNLPEVSCDILLGAGVGAVIADMVSFEEGVERIIFQAPTVSEFSQYDAYFDFSSFISMPKYEELPHIDWYLWWCGLDPQMVSSERKRNGGHIRWDAWNEVHSLLKESPGRKIFFNPRASIPLRTMPADVAMEFSRKLLQMEPEVTLVIDQPMAFKHPRLLDLVDQIDSPEKFKALCGLVDGIITVNSFASHAADMCSTPTVHLCCTIPGNHYPYYPFSAAINVKDYEKLPAFGKVKIPEEEWEACAGVYHAAWKTISTDEVLMKLHEMMAKRQAATNEPQGLKLGAERQAASCVDLTSAIPRLKRQRLAREHLHASERIAHLTKNLLKPGSVCVMACVPDPAFALALESRLAPHGELVMLEPRTLLARSLESALYVAGAFASRVHQAMPLPGASKTSINALDPWSESHSSAWGNSHQVISVPNQTVDGLALESCACLIVQSPMKFANLLMGAMGTLTRCRPFIFMTPVSREEAGNVCKTARNTGYEFWAEAALPEGDMSAMLLIACPKEKTVILDGFSRIELSE